MSDDFIVGKLPGKKEQRQRDLLNIMKSQGQLPAKTFASILGVSEMTIRRDLKLLESQPNTDNSNCKNGEYNLLQAIALSNTQKDSIGRFAASLIQPNDVIIIDTGSTTPCILPYIKENLNLTILCYNANILMELRYKPGIQLLFCGGMYHSNTEMFESIEGIHFVNRTRANKVFLSAAGVHEELGITCANAYEVPMKQAVIASSLEKILVADSSKFDQLRSSYFCELDGIDVIVTDLGLSEKWQKIIEQKKITLHMV